MPVIGSVVGLLLVAGVVFLFVHLNARRGSRGGAFGHVTRGDVRAYAKRYLKKFPDTKPTSLRESLRQEFVPERIGKRDADSDLAGCFLFGLGGMIGSAVGHHAAAAAGDAEIARIKELIDDVIEDLYAEDDA